MINFILLSLSIEVENEDALKVGMVLVKMLFEVFKDDLFLFQVALALLPTLFNRCSENSWLTFST